MFNALAALVRSSLPIIRRQSAKRASVKMQRNKQVDTGTPFFDHILSQMLSSSTHPHLLTIRFPRITSQIDIALLPNEYRCTAGSVKGGAGSKGGSARDGGRGGDNGGDLHVGDIVVGLIDYLWSDALGGGDGRCVGTIS